jgi:hypothetical protein
MALLKVSGEQENGEGSQSSYYYVRRRRSFATAMTPASHFRVASYEYRRSRALAHVPYLVHYLQGCYVSTGIVYCILRESPVDKTSSSPSVKRAAVPLVSTRYGTRYSTVRPACAQQNRLYWPHSSRKSESSCRGGRTSSEHP